MKQQNGTNKHDLKLWAYARSSSSRPSVLIQQMQGLADVRYELYIKGLSQPLYQRAALKGRSLPWRTGGNIAHE